MVFLVDGPAATPAPSYTGRRATGEASGSNRSGQRGRDLEAGEGAGVGEGEGEGEEGDAMVGGKVKSKP